MQQKKNGQETCTSNSKSKKKKIWPIDIADDIQIHY